jgi:transcriptional regulator with XRE-family HTH domain
VGQALRQLRATCGLTYEQVQLRTGLSQQMLYDVEYRDRRLTVDELRVLADCYAIGVNDILGVDVDL